LLTGPNTHTIVSFRPRQPVKFVQRTLSTLGVGLLLFFGRLASGHAADPGSFEDRKKADTTHRINAYFANIPDFDFPCSTPELLFDPKLVQAIDPKKRFEFQSLRKRGGEFDEKLAELETERATLKEIYVNRLNTAFDGYMVNQELWEAIESGDDSEFSLSDLEVYQTTERKLDEQYWAFVQQVFFTHRKARELQATVKKYYDQVIPAFDGLTLDEQKQFLEAFESRMQCLRDERTKTYTQLMQSKIALEKGMETYLKGEFANKENKGIKPLQIDEVNQQLKRMAIQVQYLWLVPEFSNHLTIYRSLLWAHDKKLRNAHLLPLIKAAQMKEPFVMPVEAFAADGERTRVREQIARIRARIAYLTLLEDEAKTEASFAINTTPVDRLVNVWEAAKSKKVTDKDIEEWVDRGGWVSRRQIDGLFMGLAAMKSILGNTLDQLITNPMQDYAIANLQSTGLFDGGWKTTAEDNWEKYQQAIAHISLRTKFLDNWAKSLTHAEGMRYVEALAIGRSKGVANRVFSDLLGNHDFTSRTRGGVLAILEVLCEDPADLRAMHYQSCRIRFEARLRDARNRLAKARGIEELSDPDAIISTADLQMGVLGPIDTWSDTFFEIPSLVKNLFGQQFGDYESQDLFMEALERQRSRLDLVLSALALPEIENDPLRLAAKYPEIFAEHAILENQLVDYADAGARIADVGWRRTQRFLRIKYTSPTGPIQELEPLGPEGESAITAAQKSSEYDLLSRNERIAFLKLEFFAYTGNYTAAAGQVIEWAKLENRKRRQNGEDGNVNVRDHELEFKAKAAAAEAVTVYESLLNEALLTMITGAVTSGLQEHLLSRIQGQEWLEDYLNKQTKTGLQRAQSVGTELLQTMLPGHEIFTKGRYAFIGMAKDTGFKLVKQKIAFEMAQVANEFSVNSKAWDQADFQAVVDQAFGIGKDVFNETYPYARDAAIRNSIGWYANEKKVNELWKQAAEAHALLRDNMQTALMATKQAKDEVTREKSWAEMPIAERLEALEAVDGRLRGATSDISVQYAMARARKIYGALETEIEDQRQRSLWLQNHFNRVSFLMKIHDAATHKIKSLGKNADKTEALNPSRLQAKAKSWENIIFSRHSVEDLEVLADPAGASLLRSKLLTPDFDIEILRSALESSINSAKARNNAAEEERIRDIAGAIDDIRIEKINSILAEFLDQSGFDSDVALVIQGGAAKGNPEYQGLFADIDFTLMVKEATSDERLTEIKEAMLEHFEKSGYRLAQEGVTSSMDSEGFVQKIGKLEPASAERKGIVADLLEKSVEPTRFYSEGGTLWFINNAAYSGKVLWLGDGQGVGWEQVPQEFGHDLAIDMTRYLGFLGSPKYTEKYLEGKSESYRRQVMESALKKTKYFIRLIDAYGIGHPQGNELYNQRIQRKPREGVESDDASYHLQIYKDAVEMVKRQDPNDPRNVIKESDLRMIERMAKMKMKGKYASPFDVLAEEGKTGAAAVSEALETMNWMRDTAPKVLAKLAGDYHGSIQARAKDPDPAKRNEMFSSTLRMMTVVKNMMTLDSPEAAPLVVSKVQNGKVLSDSEHAELIAQNIEAALAGEHVTTGLDELMHSKFESKEADQALREKVDAALESGTIRDLKPEDLALFQYEKVFKPWNDYMVWVAEQIE
jgi:hypothetical protein